MPFREIEQNEIDAIVNSDIELKHYFDEALIEIEIIRQAKELRKISGLSQQEIAEKSGLTQQMISRIEKLTHIPSLENFLKYINAIGLEIKLQRK